MRATLAVKVKKEKLTERNCFQECYEMQVSLYGRLAQLRKKHGAASRQKVWKQPFMICHFPKAIICK